MDKIKDFFRRIKERPASFEEAKKTRKEILLVAAGCFGVGVVFAGLGMLWSPFTLISTLGILAAIVFVLLWYLAGRSLKALKNRTCDQCGTDLVFDDRTRWEELRRWDQHSNNGNVAEVKTYVSVRVTAYCPKCGAEKTFSDTLCAGSVRGTSRGVTAGDMKSTEELVRNYLSGHISI